MAKKLRIYQHPLDRFLASIDDDNRTMLDYLAQKFAQEPFDVSKYRDELIKKLKERAYPRRADPGIRRPFHEILKKAGLLEELLADATLREFWKSHLLESILMRETELESKHQSVYGTSLTEHRGKVRAIQKDLKTLERLTEHYGLNDMGQNFEIVAKESLEEWRPLNLSRWKGSKEELLLGRPQLPKWLLKGDKKTIPKGLRKQYVLRQIRRDDMAIQVTIYRTLKARLHHESWKEKRIPDVLMCQLAELIWRSPGDWVLSSGETIRKADKEMST